MPSNVRMIAVGRWMEADVHVTRAHSTRRVVTDVEEAIERAWNEATHRPGVRLFDGPVCRLEAFTATDSALELVVSETSYRVNVGTNFVNPQFADVYGSEVMANCVGVSAGVISSDGFLVLGRRNGRVAYYPHRLHPFAGSLEVRPSINLFDDVRRELREEVGFTPADLASIECVGIAEDLALRHPETLFIARSTRTRAEIQTRVDPNEHGSSEAIPLSELDRHAMNTDLTPIATAVIARVRDCTG